jgi:hypothetical protein
MAAATAGWPKTAACSPKTMTFPGADTMNVGAIGDESFLSMAVVWLIDKKALHSPYS